MIKYEPSQLFSLGWLSQVHREGTVEMPREGFFFNCFFFGSCQYHMGLVQNSGYPEMTIGWIGWLPPNDFRHV